MDIKATNETISDIKDIDWNRMWKEAIQKMPKKDEKNRWDKIAPKFNEWMKTDPYPVNLAAKIHKEPDYTVLDLGCGNGSITLEIAKHVKQVTAVDMSKEMLNLVEINANEKGLSNIKYVQSRIEDIDPADIGQYDVVISSRSIGGIYNLKKELKKIDSLARKYVYMTHWSATSRQFEKDLCKVLGIEYHQHPDYMYVCNMLYQMGIYANVEPIDCKSRHIYNDLDDAMERCTWKLGWSAGKIKKEKRMKIEDFLKKNLVEKDDGTFDYTTNNPDWVLLWWKKENTD
jgi:2-polyprenyl-3-methyl-5-hydroxy-6-metoxy-1,4-benzoquinol methylase